MIWRITSLSPYVLSILLVNINCLFAKVMVYIFYLCIFLFVVRHCFVVHFLRFLCRLWDVLNEVMRGNCCTAEACINIVIAYMLFVSCWQSIARREGRCRMGNGRFPDKTFPDKTIPGQLRALTRRLFPVQSISRTICINGRRGGDGEREGKICLLLILGWPFVKRFSPC